MPILQRPGEMMPGTVRSDQARVPRLQELPNLHHVHRGNALGDADDERHAGIGGFHDGVGCARRRNKDYRCVGAGFLHRVAYRVEDGPAFMRGAALAGSDAADHRGSIRSGILGVEGPFAPRQSLHQ